MSQSHHDGVNDVPLAAVFALMSLVVGPFVLALAMTNGVSHDEHQHLAAGALWAREGLLPYRDFPYFHTPYLPFLYGTLFGWSDQLLLSARLFSAACATIMVALVSTMAFSALRGHGRVVSWVAALGVGAICCSAWLFTDSTGYAWNQEVSTLLVVVGLLVLGRGVDRQRKRWVALAGIALGLAIGFRITWAPMLAPFGLIVLLSGTRWSRLQAALAFIAGVLVALSGVFALAAIAPERFFFDTWQFAGVNIEYRVASGDPRTMTLGKKLRFLWKVVMRGDAGFMIATLWPLAVALWMRWRYKATRLSAPLSRLLAVLPFLIWGAVAPSPVFNQYFYGLIPFLSLGAVWALSSLSAGSRAWGVAVAGGVAGLLLGVGMMLQRGSYRDMGRLIVPHRWTPVEKHEEARAMRAHLPGGGVVLTLAPLTPLEAGLRIDPAFATGPFAWRVADFVPPVQAQRLGLIGPADLEAHFANRPPAGVHTGVEKEGEEPIEDYARQHGFSATQLRETETIWSKP